MACPYAESKFRRRNNRLWPMVNARRTGAIVSALLVSVLAIVVSANGAGIAVVVAAGGGLCGVR